MNRITACLLLTLALMVSGSRVHAQGYEQTLAEVMRSAPGKERARRLVELSVIERKAGRYKESIEFAVLGSSEAERSGSDNDLTKALIELANAHEAKGEIDHAIGAAMRASMVNGTYHSLLRTQALMKTAELYLNSGFPRKALEHLADAASSSAASRMDRVRYLKAEARAKAATLPPDATIKYLRSQLDEVMLTDDKALQLEFRSALATALAKTGQNKEALQTEEQVMKLAILLDHPIEAAVSANNLGELNYRMGNTEEALNAYSKGLIMVEDLPLLKLSMQVNAAHAHAKSGHQETASRLIEDALKLAKKDQNRVLMPRALRTQAAIHLLQGDAPAAQSSALEALAVAEELNDLPEQSASCDLLSRIFDERGLPAEVQVYERKARELEQKRAALAAQERTDQEAHLLRLQRTEREQTDILNREERRDGKLRQLALDAENREKQMSLLIYEKQLEEGARREAILAKEQARKELLLAQAALETERQDRMIQDMDNNRLLQSLTLSKLEFEQKAQQRNMELLERRNQVVEAESQALEAQQQRDRTVKRFSILMAVGSVIAAGLMAFAWWSTRRKKRTIWLQNQKIKGINDELAEKDKNIQSSLKYAQTIQSTILPSEADLQCTIPDSFLMYKPLDKVSGDLPYMKRIGDMVYLAAIDCTGHGVPAAMLTFIAYYGLNDLLNQFPQASCGELLDHLHAHVQKTMENRETGGMYKDGMDIGLCRLDLKTGKLQFASAQHSLLVVRNGQVTRIKGDLFPLGDDQFERNGGYKDHEMELLPSDSLFLFSDGIIHQFGGENGRKKFSLRQLTELLSGASSMELGEVKQRTEERFQEWKGDSPQTDDILMIGLRYAA